MTGQVSSFSPATRAWLDSGHHVPVHAGHRMFYHDWSPTDPNASDKAQIPVVLLHGFPTSSHDWRGVAECLRVYRRVIAFDFLGYGLSDKPEVYSYSLFDQAETVAALLAKLGVTKAHLVSHDMGTSVHCELLAPPATGQTRFRIASSTFLNGSMLQWLADITEFQEQLASNSTLQQAIELCRNSLPSFYVAALQSLMKKPEAISAEDSQVMSELLHYQEGHARLPALAGYMRERYIYADRWLGALESTKIPLQFVWAAGDPIAHVEMGRELARRCPQAKYQELPDVGHFLLMEDPATVAAKIEDFIGN